LDPYPDCVIIVTKRRQTVEIIREELTQSDFVLIPENTQLECWSVAVQEIDMIYGVSSVLLNQGLNVSSC
jgi:hypothetical protein